MNLDRVAARARLGDSGRPTPGALALFRWVVRPFVRLAFRPTLEGLERLPKSGPFLLVANHSAAIGVAEILCFASLYFERYGASLPLAGFAHPLAFHIWPISWLLRSLGAVPSSYAAGERALGEGVSILVFPGGDFETTRPIWRARDVDFGGHVGFLRLARRARVPIVPLGFRGSHFTAPILWQSRTVLPRLLVLPMLLRIKRYPVMLLGVVGATAIALTLPQWGAWRFLLAWMWMWSPLAMAPCVPWTVRGRIGDPIAPEDLFAAGDGGSDEELHRALERVEGAVRELVSK